MPRFPQAPPSTVLPDFRRAGLALVLFMLLIGLVLPPSGGRVQAQGGDAAGDAAAARDQAVAATMAADSYQFDFTVELALQSDTNLSMQIDGVGGWVRAAGTGGGNAFALQFTGEVSVESADQDESFPVTGEIRLLDDILYANMTRTDTGETTGWQGDPVSDVVGSLFTELDSSGGLFSETTTTSAADLAANPSVAPFLALLTALDPAEFITVQRDPQGAQGDTFISTLSVSDFLGTSAVEDLIATALETSGVDAAMLGQVGLIAQVLSNAVGDSAFTLEQTYAPDSGTISGATLVGSFEIDPAMINQPGSTISLALDAGVQLSSLNQPYTVEAPANAEMDDTLISADATGVTTAAPAATEIGQAPTATATSLPGPTTIDFAPAEPIATISPDTGDATFITTAQPTAEAPAAGAQPPPVSAIVPTLTPPDGMTMFITTVGKLFPNTPREIELTGSGPVDLLYQATAGEVLTVTARALETGDPLDLTLNLLNATGAVIAFNDDHATDDPSLATLDSQVRAVTIREGGEIVIRVHTFDPRQAGAVEVTLQSSLVPTPAPTAGAVEVQPDGTRILSGDVPLNGAYRLPFTGEAGSVITITVRSTSNNLDPKATLLDADGATLIENDDHAGDDLTLDSYDSQIADYALPATGDYTLVVTGFSGSGGPFELTFSGAGVGGIEISSTPTDPTPDGSPTEEGGEPTLEPTREPTQGASVPAPEIEVVGQATDTLARGRTLEYTFDAQAGEMYTFYAHALSEASDLMLTIFNEDGDYVTDNDNHGSDNPELTYYDPQLYNIIFEEDGEYTLRVSDNNDVGTDVDVTMEQIMLEAPLAADEEPVVTGEIEAGDTNEETVELQAGDLVTISLSRLTGDLDPVVALFSPDGDLLIQNDDFSSQAEDFGYYNSRINNFFIAESGTYTLEVSGYQQTRGNYALVISIRR